MKTDAEIRANRDPHIIPIATEAEAEAFGEKLRRQMDSPRLYGSNGQVARPWAYRGMMILVKCKKCGHVPDLCYCAK